MSTPSISIHVIKGGKNGDLMLFVQKGNDYKTFTAKADKDGEILWGKYSADVEIFPGVKISIQAGEETPGNQGGWHININQG